MSIDAAIHKAVAEAVAPLAKQVQELRRRIEPQEEWLTIREAAERANVTTATVRRWINDGRVEAKGYGKARRVRL